MSDDRLSEITTAIAERDHLLRVRDLLAQDIKAEEQRVMQLAQELKHEQADVTRLTTGVMGFVQQLIAIDDLEKERREVLEAQARLTEAQGSLDMLRHQHAGVAGRLGQFTGRDLAKELEGARAEKEQLLMRSGTEVGAQLQDLDIRMESIDIELVPLADAVHAGTVAFNACAEILTLLDAAAAPPNVAPVSFDAAQKKAKALAGETQAKIAIFHRALSEVATASLAEPLVIDETDASFADAWVRGLLGKRTPQERIATARESMVGRIERVGILLNAIRGRHDELARRRAALIAERTKLVG